MNRVFDITGHLLCLREWVSILCNNKRMLFFLIKKDLTTPFAGQILGSIWAIGHPLFLVCFYALVFGVFFPMKFGMEYNLPLDYTSYLLAGLVPWLCIQQAITKSCSSITANANFVKQLVFPLEILPLISVISAFVPFAIGISFLVLYNLSFYKVLYFTYIAVPFVVVLQLMLMSGIAYVLSSISVYLKDTKDIVQLYTTINMFLTPIAFLPSGTPSFLKPIFYINPFSYMVWVYQDVFFYGTITNSAAWVFVSIFYPMIFILGYRTFRKLKVYFWHAL